MDDTRKTDDLSREVQRNVDRFVLWLEDFGETSFDHQSYFAGPIGRRAKALYYRNRILGLPAVAPMILSEALLPQARKLFWKKQRFPIADAHYAMGFAWLYETTGREEYYRRAAHFLDILVDTRCPDWDNFCWGYPFDWETRGGTVPAGRPLVTITPYVYEAFAHVHRLDGQGRWLEILRSISDHMADDFLDIETGPGEATCSYSPFDGNGVINASAYRAALLADASIRFEDDRYWTIGRRNLNFVLANQQEDGSWLYAMDSVREFVDHFHTCFVLKALAKIEKLTGDEGCRQAIIRGVDYYLDRLFDEDGLPKPFSRAPRLTVYRNELYDYAESINLATLLAGRFSRLDETLLSILRDVTIRWVKPDGSFRSRRLLFGWDDVPMHRWAQAQMFRSLTYWLSSRQEEISADPDPGT
ncbi:MAG: hypothetical protein JSV26_09355 [bacterium]|nr:MAG: hypothetical protein JSV26_09355 [bacterium]